MFSNIDCTQLLFSLNHDFAWLSEQLKAAVFTLMIELLYNCVYAPQTNDFD